MAVFLDDANAATSLSIGTASVTSSLGGIRIRVSPHRASSPAATSTPFLTAVRSTVRSASSPHWRRSIVCVTAVWCRSARSGWQCSWRKRDRGSACRVWDRPRPPSAAGIAGLSLRDASGVSLPQALNQAGVPHSAASFGESHLPALMSTFVELHVEQGRSLAETDAAVGIATAIWPHGRWRWDIDGRADHAGTTRMTDRRDPMQKYAELVSRGGSSRALKRAQRRRSRLRPGSHNASLRVRGSMRGLR